MPKSHESKRGKSKHHHEEPPRKEKKESKGQKKVEKVMHEYKEGKLHSGSKKGPKVSNPKQAIAIGLSEARKAGAHVPQPKTAKHFEAARHAAHKRMKHK